MPNIIPHVHVGDLIRAQDMNRLIDAINRALKITGNGAIHVSQNASGTQLSVPKSPAPFTFSLTQNTPASQGYVTAKRLRWNGSAWQTLSSDPEIKIYDPIDSINLDSMPYRGPCNWTKTYFCGGAVWNASRGVWQIDWIEHVARFINFTLSADLVSGDTTATGDFTDFWDGVTPAAGNNGSINLLVGPAAGYQAKAGAGGTAVWRNDLDNSSKWQYQIIDIAIDCTV